MNFSCTMLLLALLVANRILPMSQRDGLYTILSEKIVRLTEDSGLVQRYLSQGLPVINLLNIKQLAADYGLPYDPAQWPERGTSAVYFETDYPGAVLLLGLAGAAVLLALCRWVRRSAGTARKEERGYHGQTESSADHPDH